MYACMYVCRYFTFINVAITVRFNQLVYNINKENGMMQQLLFLVLSSTSSFNETVTVQLIIINTENSTNGMAHKYVMYEYNMYFNIKEEILTFLLSHVT